MKEENKEINELNNMELMRLIFDEVKRNGQELNRINDELKIQRKILNEHEKRFERIDNKFNRMEQKIDSNFKYLDEKIDNAKNKLVSEMVEELDKFSISTTKLMNNLETKIRNEQDERIMEISKMKGINDYNKIILKNLESRISILEEESEKYTIN